jgi:hypothetical protein
MNSSLIFTETANRKGKRDGDEFRLQANGLENHWGADPIGERVRTIRLVKASRAAKKQAVLSVLNEYDNVNRIAFFCHGTPKGISLGFSVANIRELARAIAAACGSNVVYIGLYACLTGRGNFWGGTKNRKNLEDRKEKIVTKREGFAMLLCRELDDLGVHAVITAHLTSGHTTYNPYKVRIEKRGDYITRTRMCKAEPRDKWRAWCKKLLVDLTYRYEVMCDKIHG